MNVDNKEDAYTILEMDFKSKIPKKLEKVSLQFLYLQNYFHLQKIIDHGNRHIKV